MESLGIYYEKLYEKYKNERNSSNFFRDYIVIIGELISGFIDDLIMDNKLKEPYWHKVLKTSIDVVCKIAEIRIKDNKDISWELEIITMIYKKFMSINVDGEGIKSFKIVFTEKIVKSIEKLFKEEIKNLNGGFNIRTIGYYDAFKNIVSIIISEYGQSKDNCYLYLLEELLEKIYNPDGEYTTVKNTIKDNSYQFILMDIKEVKEKIENLDDKCSYTVIGENSEKIKFTIHRPEINQINDKIYNIYKVMLEESYNLRRYDIFYHIIDKLRQTNKIYLLDIANKFYIPINTKEKIIIA